MSEDSTVVGGWCGDLSCERCYGSVSQAQERIEELERERDNLRGSYDHVRDVLVRALGMRSHEDRALEYYTRLIVEKQDNIAAERDKLRKGINAVERLINDSSGVDGLHLNGDIATWAELRTGGRFEEWLMDFDAAMQESKP